MYSELLNSEESVMVVQYIVEEYIRSKPTFETLGSRIDKCTPRLVVWPTKELYVNLSVL